MSLILYEVKDKIATVTLNRPEKLNAYNEEMVGELYEAWRKFAGDDDAWTAIVTGAGDRAFCSGHDLDMILESDGQYKDHDSPTMWYGELEIYKPIIAAVNGYAFGGGCSLALSCDIRIASEKAAFGYPQPRYGAMSLGGHQRLPKTIPPGIAIEFILTGRTIPVEEASRWGMVNKAVPHEALMDEARHGPPHQPERAALRPPHEGSAPEGHEDARRARGHQHGQAHQLPPPDLRGHAGGPGGLHGEARAPMAGPLSGAAASAPPPRPPEAARVRVFARPGDRE